MMALLSHLADYLLSSDCRLRAHSPGEDNMKKVSAKKVAKKVGDLVVKDGASVTGGTDRPTETLSLNFTKVQYK